MEVIRVLGLFPYAGHMVAKLQEIPATFTAETGWPRFDECALVTSMTFAKEWPLQFRRYASFHKGVSAVSVGGGWVKFVEDHNLGEGAFVNHHTRQSIRGVPTELARDHLPQFQKTLRKTHMRKNDLGRLVSTDPNSLNCRHGIMPVYVHC